MMKTIKVIDLIPNAFSSEQALELKRMIEKYLQEDNKIELDFSGISKFTTLFFNFSTGYFISKIGKEKYDNTISVTNLTKLGESTYQNSYNNAIRDDEKNNDIENEIMSILNSQDE